MKTHPTKNLIPGLLLALAATSTPALAEDATEITATEIVQSLAPRPTDMIGREPAADQRFTAAGNFRGLLMQDAVTGAVTKVAYRDLAARVSEPKPTLVTGRVKTKKTVGWRSAWIKLDGRRALLVIEPGEETFPLVGRGQILSIKGARAVAGSQHTAELLSWTQIPERKLATQPLILITNDNLLEVERTVELPSFETIRTDP